MRQEKQLDFLAGDIHAPAATVYFFSLGAEGEVVEDFFLGRRYKQLGLLEEALPHYEFAFRRQAVHLFQSAARVQDVRQIRDKPDLYINVTRMFTIVNELGGLQRAMELFSDPRFTSLGDLHDKAFQALRTYDEQEMRQLEAEYQSKESGKLDFSNFLQSGEPSSRQGDLEYSLGQLGLELAPEDKDDEEKKRESLETAIPLLQQRGQFELAEWIALSKLKDEQLAELFCYKALSHYVEVGDSRLAGDLAYIHGQRTAAIGYYEHDPVYYVRSAREWFRRGNIGSKDDYNIIRSKILYDKAIEFLLSCIRDQLSDKTPEEISLIELVQEYSPSLVESESDRDYRIGNALTLAARLSLEVADLFDEPRNRSDNLYQNAVNWYKKVELYEVGLKIAEEAGLLREAQELAELDDDREAAEHFRQLRERAQPSQLNEVVCKY